MAYTDQDWTDSLVAASTGSGTPIAVNIADEYVAEYDWSAGVTAGAVVLEHSSTPTYSGSWSLVDTSNFAASSRLSSGRIKSQLGFVRARVSTTLTGGTVTVRIKRIYATGGI